jgi:hypothetical protein
MNVSPDALLYVGFLAISGITAREIWFHSKISKLSRDVEWVKNRLSQRVGE